MWVYNEDLNKWMLKDDSLSKSSFDTYKQELVSTRFYSKCLSGATYIHSNDLNDIYDTLKYKEKKNWFIPISSSKYSVTSVPTKDQSPIELDREYYTKNLNEYNLTLKNKFTPNKLIKDSINNFYYVDVCTTEQIDLNSSFIDIKIDGVRLLKGHKVLVKDQVSKVALSVTTDPNSFFVGNYRKVSEIGQTVEYEYYNEENGIYEYNGEFLIKQNSFSEYKDSFKYSVVVKLGSNTGKQFHLSRLLNGYYPIESEPMEFSEKKNWMIRNRVDYNNLLEINYYDSIKHESQEIQVSGITYSIPERTISVGEFGVILNTQNEFSGKSNVINNKYKVNLFSISETDLYYWICGEKGILLRVNKHDFEITKIDIKDNKISLNCVDFLSNDIGMVVGEFNTILITDDGGKNWNKVGVSRFNDFNYTKCIYYSPTRFFIVGENGVFIDFIKSINGYKSYKRRISEFKNNLENEYLLVDDINDILLGKIEWNNNIENIEDEFLFICTNDNKIIVYDINNNFKDFNFIYLNFNNNDYGDIISIANKENSNIFYFTSDKGLYEFDMNIFDSFDTSSDVNNTCYGLTGATNINTKYYNNLFDYKGEELILSGNESLLENYEYVSSTFTDIIDSEFSDRYKSKMLFMNYDIASKLNFFRDNGDYRLPEKISFIPYSYVELKRPVISGVTQSTWFDYYRDSLQTFEHANPIGLDESKKVVFSTKFEGMGVFGEYEANITSTNVSTNLNDILPLSPEIGSDTYNKFYSLSSPSTPFVSKDLYLYKDLMVLKLNILFLNRWVVGDVIRLESSEIESNLIINKIYSDSSNIYVYTHTEFNENIIRSIKDNGCKIINLNKFSDPNQIIDRFNKHPLSIGYEMNIKGPAEFEISAKFNNKTAYYNLACTVETDMGSYDFKYTDSFINFGYSPVYNILGYLKNIDSTLFYDDKEYLAMPVYKNIPLGPLPSGGVYIDTGILNNNKLVFSSNLKFEYDSIFIDTFIDIIVYGSSTQTTERLLVMNKYYDSSNDSYVIEFHKKLKFDTSANSIDIISRRKLIQISDDLRILNNIQKSSKTKEINTGYEYFVYDNELNFKIKTNSYTNILLSDQDTKDNISTIIYTDSSNELSMNIINLDESIFPEITSIVEYNGKVSIIFKDPHNLQNGNTILVSYNGDNVGTATNGCYPSTSGYDPNFFGYHVVQVLSNNTLLLDIPWNPAYIVNNFIISFIKKDYFLNYSPIDLVDMGVNKIGKTAIELSPVNLVLKDNRFVLDKVDFNKFRYRLFDGLTINDLIVRYPWILEAEISDALIGLVDDELTWYSGTWECGRWFEGRWVSGYWLSGDFYGGTWDSKMIVDKKISVEIADKNTINTKSIWFKGRWFGGEWNGGIFRSGRWYEGSFNQGEWLDGIWNNGDFNNGKWKGGIWIKGNFNNGIFNTDNKPSYWLDGNFNGGDFGNGIWYNGVFESKNSIARFGTESFNSRTSIWHGGNFVSGSFHSNLNLDENGDPIRSKINKYSIWHTGNFISGDFYGGITYHINFNGTWHGGVLEDIQVIGVENVTGGKRLKLNGSFKFNIGNDIIIMDNDLNTFKTKVFYVEEGEDSIGKFTYISTTPNININISNDVDKYRVVSEFSNATWKSGIWTNGVFSSGLWEGGLFYNGIFSGVSI